MIPVLGLIVGLIVGIFLPGEIPSEYSIYVAVGILAALDSVMGGGVAAMEERFDIKMFLSGFLGNIFLAVLLTFIGDKMGIQLYMAAIFAFVLKLPPEFVFIALKSDQILKCPVAFIKTNRYKWIKKL